MTTAGWIFMMGSLVLVWGLATWCYLRVLRPRKDSPPESSAGPYTGHGG